MSPEVAALLHLLALKDLPREGWRRRGLREVESVAAHSHGVSWLVLALLPPELDLERALTFAVLHDLAEVEVGDLVPADGVAAADKRTREDAAFERLSAALPRREALREAWSEYAAQASPEARFVREIDRLDMALQAHRYAEQHGLDPREFLASAREAILSPALLLIWEQLLPTAPR